MRVVGEELAAVARALRAAGEQVPQRAVASALDGAANATRGGELADALAELETSLDTRLRALGTALESLASQVAAADATFGEQDAQAAEALTRVQGAL